MKTKIISIVFLPISLLIVILFIYKNENILSFNFDFFYNKNATTSSKISFLSPLPEDAIEEIPKVNNLELPSPTYRLSTTEKARFPQGVVIESKIESIIGSEDKMQIRIIKTDTHLGYVRTEEVIDSKNNQLLHRVEMRSNSILVGLRPAIKPEDLVKINPSFYRSFKPIIPDENVYEFTLNEHDSTALPRAIEFTQQLQGTLIDYIEPNYIATSTKEPNDPDYPALWGLTQISAPRAWDTRSETTPYPIVVAVVDTGIDFNHEDLKGNMWKNPDEIPGNGIDDDKNGYIDDVFGANLIPGIGQPGSGNVMDVDGHGTHVAGIIAAVGNNNIGITGVAWNLLKFPTLQPKNFGGLMAVKCMTTSGGTWGDISAAITYAVKRKADIINLSLGGASDSITLKNAVRSAQGRGIILICSAGNDGVDIDDPSGVNKRYPCSYDFDNIVTVGASDPADGICSFSNYGKTSVDIFAPGDIIYSTLPLKSYGSMSGTSMAAPHVTGSLALLKAQYPSEGYKGWISRLYGKADKITPLNPYCVTGARVNLYQSINNISVRPTPTPRDNPDFRSPPVNRGGISRDIPSLRSPSSPNPRPTPRQITTPSPRTTPRPRI